MFDILTVNGWTSNAYALSGRLYCFRFHPECALPLRGAVALGINIEGYFKRSFCLHKLLGNLAVSRNNAYLCQSIAACSPKTRIKTLARKGNGSFHSPQWACSIKTRIKTRIGKEVLQDFVWVMPYLPIGTQVSHLRPMANHIAEKMGEPQVRHLRTMHQPIP